MILESFQQRKVDGKDVNASNSIISPHLTDIAFSDRQTINNANV